MESVGAMYESKYKAVELMTVFPAARVPGTAGPSFEFIESAGEAAA